MEDALIVQQHEGGVRLDKVLAMRFPRQSRNFIQLLLAHGQVKVNEQIAKKSYKLEAGDHIVVTFAHRPEPSLEPEPMALDLLYEDDALLAVNKPCGLVVHPGIGNWSGTFVNGLLHYCKQLPQGPEELRPGIVHRLDKETSGVLLAAKTGEAQAKLMQQFKEQRIKKEYRAICVGNPGACVMEGAIARHKLDRKRFTVSEGGRPARTVCKTLQSNATLSLVALYPQSGRTHQLRVHLQHRGTPILGDSTYGSAYWNKKLPVARHLLHAYAICFEHPQTGELKTITAPIPSDFHAIAHTAGFQCERNDR